LSLAVSARDNLQCIKLLLLFYLPAAREQVCIFVFLTTVKHGTRQGVQSGKMVITTVEVVCCSFVQVSVVSAHLQSIRAVVKSERRDLAVDGFVYTITLKELGNMNGDKFEQYFTSGRLLSFYFLLLTVTKSHYRAQLMLLISVLIVIGCRQKHSMEVL